MPGPRPGTGGAPARPRNRKGRPPKFTPERVEAILERLRDGNTRKVAALCAGVHPSTMCDWQNNYPEFAKQVEEAEAEAEASLVRNLRGMVCGGDRLAAQFILERRFHQDWRERKEQQVRVEIDDPIESLESQWTLAAEQGAVLAMATEPDAGTAPLARS